MGWIMDWNMLGYIMLIAGTVVFIVYVLVGINDYRSSSLDIGRLLSQVEHHTRQIEYLMNQRDGEELAWELNCHDKLHHYEYKFGRIEYYNKEQSSNPITGTNIYTLTLLEAKNKLNEVLARQHESCLTLSEEEQKIILDHREADWDDRYVLLRKKEVASMRRKQKKGKRK